MTCYKERPRQAGRPLRCLAAFPARLSGADSSTAVNTTKISRTVGQEDQDRDQDRDQDEMGVQAEQQSGSSARMVSYQYGDFGSFPETTVSCCCCKDKCFQES